MKSFLFTCITLLVFQVSFAQYGYPNQRQRVRASQQRAQRSAPLEPVKKDPTSIVAAQMPTYTEALELDAFQQEILKGMLIDYHNNRETVRIDMSIKFEERQDMLIKLEDDLHEKLSTILPEEKIKAFKEVQFLDEKEKKKKKKRRKKKSKKDKDKTDKGTH